VIVTATARDSDLVELRMEEQSAGRVLPARRAAVDADASDVVERILLGDRLMPQDAVRKAGVLEVLPADIVKGLRAVGGPHAVDLHDDEAEVSKRRKSANG